ncbi:MAG: c-type cytochrome, partial [Planctomycetaceae bacterium]
LLAATTERGGPLTLLNAILRGLGDGLGRRGSSIPKLLNQADDDTRKRTEQFFATAADAADSDTESIADRATATALLAYADFDTAADVLTELLTPATPQQLQIAAVAALSEHDEARVAELLLDSWRSYSPPVRREAVDALLMRAERIGTLLDAVAAGSVRPNEIERDKTQILLNHPNDKVRTQARKLLGGASSNRAQVVEQYRRALEIDGDTARGREIYVKHCSACHKLGETGHQVGPEFASVKNKSADDLLIAILDPSREAQSNFQTYTVVTTQGKLISGIIAEESSTSVTLRRAEGKQDVVLRQNIAEMVSNGLSLMPEGLEKELNPEQMADLLAFVKTLVPATTE